MQSGDDLEDERGKLKRVEVGIEDEKSMQGLIWRQVRGRLRIHRFKQIRRQSGPHSPVA